jgi:hypothetical protein
LEPSAIDLAGGESAGEWRARAEGERAKLQVPPAWVLFENATVRILGGFRDRGALEESQSRDCRARLGTD